MKKLIILFVFICSARIMVAQPYYFRRYQVENGLSNNTVFCSAQDGAGFMWFGTKDGLNRFDGYAFKTYRHDPDKKESLGNDLVYGLHIDDQKTLWVGTNDGIFEYLPQRENFRLIAETKGMRIIDMLSDKQGNLWIISSFRLYLYHKASRKFYTFGKEVNFDASSLFLSKSGNMWVSTGRGTVERFLPKSKTFISYPVNGKNQKREYGWVSKIAETSNGQLLIGTTNQGLKLLNPQTLESENIVSLNEDQTPVFVRDIKQTHKHEFWIGTESGIYIFNDSTRKTINLRKQYNNEYAISDNAIYSIFCDREGGVWTGSYFGGINYYSARTSLFSKYFPQKNSNSISGSDVREITKDANGNFWIGTEDAGLNKFNPKTGLFKHFLPDGKRGSISYSNIHGLLIDGNKLWVGTFEHGLDLFDLKTEKVIKHYQAGNGNQLRTNFIVTFLKTSKGEILVATINGIYLYNRKKDDFEPIPNLPFFFYDSLCEDHDGNIWAGTFNDGVFRFSLNGQSIANFKNVNGDSTSISHNTINSIFSDSQNKIWVTTDGGGLNLFNKGTGRFKRYGVKNGFPSNYLFKIEEDQHHKFWISSTRGLIHFDPKTSLSITYSKTNGLLTDQFNYNSAFKDVDGRMYFGSVKGLISFDPAAFKQNNFETRTFLTGFQINGQETTLGVPNSILYKSIVFTDTITLNDSQSSFSFDFAALNFQSPEMTEYAYKMTGLYKDWEYLKTNRKVYFTKLSPGKYTFEVKALVEGSSQWSSQNAKIVIRVLPPFYLSNWAYLIYTLLFACVIFLLIRRYHRKQELKNSRRMEVFEHKKQKEVYQAKIEFFTNVAHEIRTPLTLIIGPMEKLIKQAQVIPSIEKNLRIMNRNTDRLLQLTNQLLDFRKTEASEYSLNFVKADVVEILRDVILQFQPAAEQQQVSCTFESDYETLSAYIDVEAFYKIISNLIDNAIKYGQNKAKVLLTTDHLNEKFEVQVVSNGLKIGAELEEKIFEPFFRAKETDIKTGTGIGLSISRSLAQLHNGKLWLLPHDGLENIFMLELPMHQLIEFNLKGKWEKL